MKPKLKLIIDLLMAILLLFLMGYQFWGETAHEWIGAGMFLLYLFHHILNRNWYKTLCKGKLSAVRILSILTDFLLLLAMLAQMYSGIVMSRYVFAFLPIDGGMAVARKLHILGAYWGFILMSFHIGLHLPVVLGMVHKQFGIKVPSRLRSFVLNIAELGIALYGIYAFIQRDFSDYMFLQSEFVFLDYEEPKLFFYLDILAIAGLCLFAAHWLSKGCKKLQCRKEHKITVDSPRK